MDAIVRRSYCELDSHRELGICCGGGDGERRLGFVVAETEACEAEAEKVAAEA